MKYIKVFEYTAKTYQQHQLDDEDVNTQLLDLCDRGFTETKIKILVENLDADVNTQDKNNGDTPLIKVARVGNYKMVKYFIDKGADVNLNSKISPLICVILNFHNEVLKELVQLLIDKGADVNFNSELLFTPLIAAMHKGTIAIFKMLLENGADIYDSHLIDFIKELENDKTINPVLDWLKNDYPEIFNANKYNL